MSQSRSGRAIVAVAIVATSIVILTGAPAALAEHRLVVDFEDPDLYDDDPEDDPAWPEFIDVRDDDERSLEIRGFLGSGMQVFIPEYTHRGAGGLLRFDPTPDEAWYRYYLRLDWWNATSSGKLPGPAGLYGSSGRGCIPSSPSNPGWSARTLFEATEDAGPVEGRVQLGTYLYHLDQAGTCGDQIHWEPGLVEQNRWYCVEGRVRMNTPGADDGRVDAWIDGRQVLAWPGVAFRRSGEDIGVRHFWFDIYFGGRVVNPTTLWSSYDQLVVSHEGRVGCLEPFLDDDTSAHEADLAELHARSIWYGCGERLACPMQLLTRGEMAALLTRALGLPAGADAFDDDDGHFAEHTIDALAAAGITKGCGVRTFCPDDPISRGEMAVFLQRAFLLPDGPDVFEDDDGHFAEAAINAVAAAGITKGCDGGGFCPNDLLPREQAATLLRRSLGFNLPPATLAVAGPAERIGTLAPATLDDDEEPLPLPGGD